MFLFNPLTSQPQISGEDLSKIKGTQIHIVYDQGWNLNKNNNLHNAFYEEMTNIIGEICTTESNLRETFFTGFLFFWSSLNLRDFKTRSG
jgi:hypothetical protein